MGLNEVRGSYMALEGVARGYKRLGGVTKGKGG